MPSCRAPVHICLVYDCLYPRTVGGAERWYRNLAERLAREGHEVTYLTMRQWERGEDPGPEGVRVLAVTPRMRLYGSNGNRRVLPPLLFGAGVLVHLLAHGSRYDAVHTASFPYFSLLAAAAVRPLRRFRLVVDWFEVWTPDYWREYLGPVGGRLGWLVQRLCVRVHQHAFCFSRLHAGRLAAEGLLGQPELLHGLYAGTATPSRRSEAEPVVLFAGRHVPDKGVTALIPAIAIAREHDPHLRGEILGDGPERPAVLRAIADHRLENAVRAPGFVSADEVERSVERALCVVLPSRREGYGLVVVEAAAAGTPSVVAAAPDSAATELIDDGENGFVAKSADPHALADAILRVRDAGAPLRERTTAWFQRNADRLSIEHSLRAVAASYRRRS